MPSSAVAWAARLCCASGSLIRRNACSSLSVFRSIRMPFARSTSFRVSSSSSMTRVLTMSCVFSMTMAAWFATVVRVAISARVNRREEAV